ncbi:MAG: hypothetical protein K2K06_09020 [Oscillospiraceae bacterium]|nr:hypothetical protein [Oscillospiraceae bacterium]
MGTEKRNSKFTMLGMSCSGKTCYIAGMYMKMSTGVNGFTLVAEDDVRMKLEREIRALRRYSVGIERFPQLTYSNLDAVRNYKFRMCYNLKEIVSFEMQDYSGGSLTRRDEVYLEVKRSIVDSTALYVFVDGKSFCSNDREERKENVYYDCAMTLCPMIQDFADAHNGVLPPIIFVVTKADLCKKYVNAQEIVSVIKEFFRPAFSENTTSYICAVSLGETISDDDYKGKLSPFNVHIPFFIGCYHEYYNRYAILKHDVDKANNNLIARRINLEADIDAENRRWRIFRNKALIEEYRERISVANNDINFNRSLLKESKDMLIRFGVHLEHEKENFFYFKDGRQIEFREFQI